MSRFWKGLRITGWVLLGLFLVFIAAAPWGWTGDLGAVAMIGGWLAYRRLRQTGKHARKGGRHTLAA